MSGGKPYRVTEASRSGTCGFSGPARPSPDARPVPRRPDGPASVSRPGRDVFGTSCSTFVLRGWCLMVRSSGGTAKRAGAGRSFLLPARQQSGSGLCRPSSPFPPESPPTRRGAVVCASRHVLLVWQVESGVVAHLAFAQKRSAARRRRVRPLLRWRPRRRLPNLRPPASPRNEPPDLEQRGSPHSGGGCGPPTGDAE